MLPPDYPDKFRQIVAEISPETLEDIFRAATELPGFIIAVASCEGDDLQWLLDGWSVDGVRWEPSSLTIRWTMRAKSGELTLKLPVLYRLDEGLPDGVVELFGEVEQTDDQWEELRADVVSLAYPQAVKLSRPFGVFEVGEVLLLDAEAGAYIRPSEVGRADAARVGMKALVARNDLFEVLKSWPE